MPNIEKHKVLILLAAHNGESWIREQVDSILMQEDVCITLLVRDDFSRDATINTLRESYGDNPCVFIIESDRASGSSGAAFFELFLIAKAEEYSYVALADQDDIWFPDKLIRAIDKINISKSVGYSSAVLAFWESGHEIKLSQSCDARDCDFLFEGAGQGCTYVMTSGFFLDIQRFIRREPNICRAMHYHDWLIYLLARTWGYKWYFDEHESMLYRQHSSNEIGARGSVSGIHRRLMRIKDGWYKKQIDSASRLFLAARKNESEENDLAFTYASGFATKSLEKYKILLFNSRRKLIDRIVLFVVAVFGWI